MDTGDIIKSLRERNGWTQEELGEKVGVKKSAVAKWENGRVENLKRNMIESLSKLFGVAPSYLVGWDDGNRFFHKNLRFLLEYHEKDINTLCNESEISTDRIKGFLHDKLDPTKKELFTIAAIFQVDPIELLTKKMTSISHIYSDEYGDDTSTILDEIELYYGYGIRQIVEQAKNLNTDGCNRVIEYIRDLSDKYKKEEL